MDKNTHIIVYPNGEYLGLVIPAPECELSLEEIARKDVPKGLPYKIVAKADVPTDWSFRDAWETDFSNPDGYGIWHDEWFAEQAAKEQT